MILKYTDFLLESKSQKGKIPIPLRYLFSRLPKTVDYRIVEFMINNYNKVYYKSPYSHSYYSELVDWDMKPHLSYRMSDHWNFYTNDIIHCQTTNDPGLENSFWSIGQYNSNIKKYTILMKYPFRYDIKNIEKITKLKNEYLRKYPIPINPNIDIMKKKYSYISKITKDLEFYINDEKVKLLRWGSGSIKFIDNNGEEKIIKHKDLSRRTSYKGYLNGELIIEKPKKGTFTIHY